MRCVAGLETNMNERIAVAFFPAAGTPAMVLPTLETPRAKAQARFPMTFYAWDDADGPAGALRRCAANLGMGRQRSGAWDPTRTRAEPRAIYAAAARVP